MQFIVNRPDIGRFCSLSHAKKVLVKLNIDPIYCEMAGSARLIVETENALDYGQTLSY
jgi:hypothetical protein